jgi:uncharacterized Zn-finger protein
MSETSTTPHFHNAAGVPAIRIGAREFMCIGAPPPQDHPHIFLDLGDAEVHPHIFLDLGDAEEIVCPYCSTLYRFDPSLAPGAAVPPEAAWHGRPAAMA